MWQQLFKNKKKSERRQPKPQRLNLEQLESRLVPTGVWTAAESIMGVLTVQEIASSPSGSKLSISETGGVITVAGGSDHTSVNGGSFATFPGVGGSHVNTIVVNQLKNGHDLSLDISTVSLSNTLTVNLGTGKEKVTSTGDTLNALIVLAPSNGSGKSESVTSKGDTLNALFVHENNASDDSIEVSGLKGNGITNATQGNGNYDEIEIDGSSVGQLMYTQGNGHDDSIDVSNVFAVSVTAKQGNGDNDSMTVDSCSSATSTALVIKLTQGNGASDSIEANQILALDLEITQGNGGDSAVVENILVGNLDYSGGTGVNYFEAENAFSATGFVDGGDSGSNVFATDGNIGGFFYFDFTSFTSS